MFHNSRSDISKQYSQHVNCSSVQKLKYGSLDIHIFHSPQTYYLILYNNYWDKNNCKMSNTSHTTYIRYCIVRKVREVQGPIAIDLYSGRCLCFSPGSPSSHCSNKCLWNTQIYRVRKGSDYNAIERSNFQWLLSREAVWLLPVITFG